MLRRLLLPIALLVGLAASAGAQQPRKAGLPPCAGGGQLTETVRGDVRIYPEGYAWFSLYMAPDTVRPSRIALRSGLKPFIHISLRRDADRSYAQANGSIYLGEAISQSAKSRVRNWRHSFFFGETMFQNSPINMGFAAANDPHSEFVSRLGIGANPALVVAALRKGAMFRSSAYNSDNASETIDTTRSLADIPQLLARLEQAEKQLRTAAAAGKCKL